MNISNKNQKRLVQLGLIAATGFIMNYTSQIMNEEKASKDYKQSLEKQLYDLPGFVDTNNNNIIEHTELIDLYRRAGVFSQEEIVFAHKKLPRLTTSQLETAIASYRGE